MWWRVRCSAGLPYPSGASTGEREALELRDGDKSRYLGKGVRGAIAHINNEIANALVGTALFNSTIHQHADRPRRHPESAWGPNALLGVSMAAAKTGAQAAGRPLYEHLARLAGRSGDSYVLPVPMMNILNRGAHADSNVDLQEYMVMPLGAPSFSEALRAGTEIFHALRAILKKTGHSTGVGDEGGLRPQSQVQPRSARGGARSRGQGRLHPRRRCLHRPGRRRERTVERRELYVFKKSGEPNRTSSEMVELWTDWVRDSPIVSIEDRLAEGDWEGWGCPHARALGDRVQLVGDDVFVTNPEILKQGIAAGVGNAVLVKLNQIGTVSETLDAIAIARDAGYATIISHRSGETEDSTIADLAVGTSAGQIKTGQPAGATASRNTTNCCASKKSSARRRCGRSAVRQLAVSRGCMHRRTPPPRRERLEPGEPVHRLDRRGPDRTGGVKKPGTQAV